MNHKVGTGSMNSEERFCNSTYDQVRMAERELSAFIRAVTQLFGSEEAKLSAEDWLDESELMDSPPLSTGRNWRAVTIAASARLAHRLAAAQHRGSDRSVGAGFIGCSCQGFARQRAGCPPDSRRDGGTTIAGARN